MPIFKTLEENLANILGKIENQSKTIIEEESRYDAAVNMAIARFNEAKIYEQRVVEKLEQLIVERKKLVELRQKEAEISIRILQRDLGKNIDPKKLINENK